VLFTAAKDSRMLLSDLPFSVLSITFRGKRNLLK
jgi:hypothetical protein